MELKEMSDTGVIIANSEEALEFFMLALAGGWKKNTVNKKIIEGTFKNFPVVVSCEVLMRWSDKDNLDWFGRSITLAEFKKEQGIMKYKEGDVLENPGGYTRKVLGVCGLAYIMSSCDSFDEGNNDSIFTESQLDGLKYNVKTDKPAKTDMTVSELEVAAGLPAGSLNVVAES